MSVFIIVERNWRSRQENKAPERLWKRSSISLGDIRFLNLDVDVYTSSKALSAPIYGAQYDFSGLGFPISIFSPFRKWISNMSSQISTPNVSFHYCGTELEVAAREQSTGKIMKAKLDFIGWYPVPEFTRVHTCIYNKASLIVFLL
jgi:hypothetical protein